MRHLPALAKRLSKRLGMCLSPVLLSALLLSCGPNTQEDRAAALGGDQTLQTVGLTVAQTAEETPPADGEGESPEAAEPQASEPEAALEGEAAEETAPADEAEDGEAAPSAPSGGPLLAEADLSSGETVYSANCVSCHQAEGQGVPGAFPPLAGHTPELALPEGGRDYLVNVLLYGLQGEIEVDGQSYNGVMPAWQQLSDEELAGVLNYTLSSWGNLEAMPEDYAAFTPEEVAEQRDAGLSAAQVYEQRQALPEAPAPEAGGEAASDTEATGEAEGEPAAATEPPSAGEQDASASEAPEDTAQNTEQDTAQDTEQAGAMARQDSPEVAAAKAVIPYQYREKTAPSLFAFGINLNPASNRSSRE